MDAANGIFSRTGNIVFVQGNEVAVVQKGLEQFESRQSKSMSKQPSKLGRLSSGLSSRSSASRQQWPRSSDRLFASRPGRLEILPG